MTLRSIPRSQQRLSRQFQSVSDLLNRVWMWLSFCWRFFAPRKWYQCRRPLPGLGKGLVSKAAPFGVRGAEEGAENARTPLVYAAKARRSPRLQSDERTTEKARAMKTVCFRVIKPNTAPANIATTAAIRRCNRGLVSRPSEESAAMPVMVNVSTVVVMSGTASLRGQSRDCPWLSCNAAESKSSVTLPAPGGPHCQRLF